MILIYVVHMLGWQTESLIAINVNIASNASVIPLQTFQGKYIKEIELNRRLAKQHLSAPLILVIIFSTILMGKTEKKKLEIFFPF